MRNKWWRSHPKLMGTLAYFCFKVLRYSLLIQVQADPTIDPKRPYLFAFWHGKQLLPSLMMPKIHFTDLCTMASPSRDGAILSEYLHRSGFEVIRGSSRDNSIAALLKMRKRVSKGASLGFAVDGPVGPIYTIKPGMLYLAQNCNIPIVPIGSAFKSAWTFRKAWDKFQVPKPFSKAAIFLHKPYVVTKDIDITQACRELELQLQKSEQIASQML